MILSSKIQGLNYGAPLLGFPKSMYYIFLWCTFNGYMHLTVYKNALRKTSSNSIIQ